MKENVVIVGASPKSARYSNQAQVMLTDYGHNPIPVSSRGHDVLGVKGYQSISEVPESVDTVTIYINAELHKGQYEKILAKRPKRIIFNPGTESDELMTLYRNEGIDAFEACTLVLLRTNQY